MANSSDDVKKKLGFIPMPPVALRPKPMLSFVEDDNSPVIDRVTGKRVKAPSDMKLLQQLILEKRLGYAPEHRVNILDGNGESYNVGGDYLYHALSNGYTLESPIHQGAREYAKRQGSRGAGVAFLANMVDALTFGASDKLIKLSGDGSERAEYEKAKGQALRDANKEVGYAGTAVGILASLPLGGPVAKAGQAAERAVLGATKAEAGNLASHLVVQGVENAPKVSAGIMRQTVASAAKMGVEGALFSAPSAVTEAALGDPEKAAEHMLIGFGVSAVLGAGSKLAGETLKYGAKKASSVIGNAESNAVNSIFYSRDKANQKLVDAFPGGEQAFGRKLLDKKLIRPGEGLDELSKRIVTNRRVVGEEIGALTAEMDSAGSRIRIGTTDEIADRIERTVIAELKKDPAKRTQLRKIENYTKAFREVGQGRNLTFQEAHAWRQGLDDLIYDEGKVGVQGVAGEHFEKIRNMLTKEIEDKGEKIAAEKGQEFVSRWRAANEDYRFYKIAGRIVDNSANTAKQNRWFSPSDHIVGGLGMMADVARGDDPDVSSVAKGLAFAYGNKFLREKGRAHLALILDKMKINSRATALLRHGLEHGEKSGVIMAEKALADGARELDKIPSLLDRLSVKRHARQSVVRLASNTVSELALADDVADIMANSGQLEQNIETLSSIVRDQGAPEIGRALAAKQLHAAQYIMSQAPKPELPDPYKPSVNTVPKGELTKYARKVEIVNNPYSILKHIEDGTMTEEHLEALTEVYPKLANEMLGRIDSHAYSGKMDPLSSRGQMMISDFRAAVQRKTRKQQATQPTLYDPKILFPKQKPIAAGQLKNLPQLEMSDADRVMMKGIGSKK